MGSPALYQPSLKVLPAYTGCTSLEEALTDPRHQAPLWLEVLFNDRLDVAVLLRHPRGRDAYETACRWYTHFRSLIQFIAPRKPLPVNTGPLDYRHYRTFIEALYFVSPDA
jgi:hypothetical protein